MSASILPPCAGLDGTLGGSSGRGVRIGVIDSGWDRSMADARVLPGCGIAPAIHPHPHAWTGDDGDRNGHGTACAHLVLRVAPESRIIPLRIFGEELETTPHALAAAIRRGAELGLDVLNVSMGTLGTAGIEALYRACQDAMDAGTIVVAAAHGRLGWSSPAIFANAIGVGALPERGRVIAHRPEQAVECLALAEHADVPWPGGGRRTIRGTSFAAPVVSGIVALLREREPGASLARIRKLLAECASASPLPHPASGDPGLADRTPAARQ